MKALLAKLGLGEWKKREAVGRRPSVVTAERRRFEEEVRDQFLKLKEKGLGIRVFTL